MDEWGRDPSVKAMRRVFNAMEKTLDDHLEQLDVSPFDYRIRGWLEQALANYECVWGEAGRMGVRVDEKMAPKIYSRCLVKVIGLAGIEIPESLLAVDKDVERLISEVIK